MLLCSRIWQYILIGQRFVSGLEIRRGAAMFKLLQTIVRHLWFQLFNAPLLAHNVKHSYIFFSQV